MVAGAQHEVILGAPYAQSGALSAGPLANALDAALRRGVRVDWVSTPAALPALRIRAGSAGVLRFYQPEGRLLAEPGTLGSHAKFLVVDEAHAYVGSANFTGRGFRDQLEMGLLVHGEPAREIARFWRYAIEIGLLVEVRT
ncbi:MAG TPA: phospholipase D family protein [Longimicrobiaceae bacterium]|nr:phospholipase D family protein [Longimicrobiaceae bacterium]